MRYASVSTQHILSRPLPSPLSWMTSTLRPCTQCVCHSLEFILCLMHSVLNMQHVYSNGHVSFATLPMIGRLMGLSFQICASILGNEWSPVLTVNAVCLTLQSMLASCKVRLLFPSMQDSFLTRVACQRKERSVLPMLAPCLSDPENRPPDNDRYVSYAPSDPRKARLSLFCHTHD